jgi:hypothetical protein
MTEHLRLHEACGDLARPFLRASSNEERAKAIDGALAASGCNENGPAKTAAAALN